MSTSGLTLLTRSEAEARAQRARGFDPAMLDPNKSFFDGVVIQASPKELSRRNRLAQRNAALCWLAVAAVVIGVCVALVVR